MTGVDAAHAWMLHGGVFAAVIAAALVSPVLSWLLAQALVGRAPRAGRGAAAVGHAALGVLLLVCLLRLAEAGGALPAGGPEGWLLGLGKPKDGWFPRDAVLVLALVHAVCFPVWTTVAALRLRPHEASDVRTPAGDLLAAALLLAAPAGLLAAWGKLGQQADVLLGLDLVAAAPVLLAALAVRTRAHDEPTTQTTPSPTSLAAEPAAQVDVVAAWSALGALSLQAPTFGHTGTSSAAGDPVAAEAWSAAGAQGAAPIALDEIATHGDENGLGRFIGDLPAPTEHRLLAAAVRLAVRAHALRVLLVHDSHESIATSVRTALDDGGGWRAGTLVEGIAALREALGRGLLPDVVVLRIDELSAEGLRISGEDRHGAGRRWASTLGMIVLPAVDRGHPLQVTHRAFTLRRLHLALQAAGARVSLLATGFTGRGSLALVRRAFPDLVVRDVPLRPRATLGVSAWLANYHFFRAAEGPWARRAGTPIATRHPVAISDPTGQLDREDVAVWGADLRLSRGISFDGPASIAMLDDVWLVAAYRALAHRIPTADAGHHHTLWGLQSDPVTRFLIRDGNLANLQLTGRLPAPQPVVGHANRAVARAHLRAATSEGVHDVALLSAAFGPSLVDELLRQVVPDSRQVARVDAEGRLQRSAVVPGGREHGDDPLRPVVTDKVLRLVDADSGAMLGEVDALTSPTRYYPRRVFAWRGRRYEVPMHALDARRERLEVRPVPADHALTFPRLALRVTAREIVEAPQQVHAGALVFSLATFDALVDESVSGVRRGKDDAVAYPTVSTKYRTRVRGIFFRGPANPRALHHLARSFEGALRSHLLIEDDDVEAVASDEGWWTGLGPGLLVVDRHVQGVGVAEALDEPMVRSVLDWVYAILSRCTCQRGCSKCTSWDVLEDGGADKEGALALIGG